MTFAVTRLGAGLLGAGERVTADADDVRGSGAQRRRRARVPAAHGVTQALRTGVCSKTLTLTLSTTTP
jgi:hypothetical protein